MMSQHEKAAWYQLAVVALAFAACFAILPYVGPSRATAGFGLLGFIGLIPLLFFRRKGGSRVLADERDQAIQRTAMLVGLGTFWMLFIVGYLTVWWLFSGRECVPIEVVLSTPWVGFALVYLAQCVATLVQYRRGA